MDRRDFIKSSIAVAGSLGLAKLGFGQAAVKSRRILIVGAGLSGLVSAYELKKLGHDVTVLEAQKRAGGRVITLRDFADGQYADAGAARIPEDHDLTHRYIREFGLPLIPFYPTTDKFSRMRNGRAERVNWDGFAEATRYVMGLSQPDHWQKIKGGNDLLPDAFVETLRRQMKYDAPVARIDQTAGEIITTFIENGNQQTIKSDLMICAIPLTMLRNIQFAPKLSDAKMNIITTSTYDSASRIFVQTKDRFWLKQKLNGFAFGERSDEIWDATFGEPGTHGILESYSRGSYSRELSTLTNDQRTETVSTSFEKLFPGVKGNVAKGLSKCWTEDPWVKGAWARLSPDEAATLIKPEKRIYFAGEHLSFSPSWMQGALQSGLYAVQQISKIPVA